MIFSAILRVLERRSKAKPPPKMSGRGGGLLENPNPPGRAEKWQPPTKGTSPADRKRIRRRNRKRRRLSHTAPRND